MSVDINMIPILNSKKKVGGTKLKTVYHYKYNEVTYRTNQLHDNNAIVQLICRATNTNI